MKPPAEMVHWLFATGMLLLGLCLLSEAIVGEEVWRRRWWRVYLWPGLAFFLGVALWPVMVLFTNSAIHMLAHGAWAQVMMLGGAAELGLVRGKLKDSRWELTLASPLVDLPKGKLTVSVKDRQGNLTRIERCFSVAK